MREDWNKFSWQEECHPCTSHSFHISTTEHKFPFYYTVPFGSIKFESIPSIWLLSWMGLLAILLSLLVAANAMQINRRINRVTKSDFRQILSTDDAAMEARKRRNVEHLRYYLSSWRYSDFSIVLHSPSDFQKVSSGINEYIINVREQKKELDNGCICTSITLALPLHLNSHIMHEVTVYTACGKTHGIDRKEFLSWLHFPLSSFLDSIIFSFLLIK